MQEEVRTFSSALTLEIGIRGGKTTQAGKIRFGCYLEMVSASPQLVKNELQPAVDLRPRFNKKASASGTTASCSSLVGALTCAGDVVIPVNKGSLWVVAPCPDVNFEKRGNIEAVGRAHEIEDLSVEDWRRVVVGGEPSRGVEDELDANQRQLAVGRLVDQGLGLRGVEREIAEERGVHIVDPHRTVVGTGNAAEKWSVAGGGGIVNVDELTRAVSNCLNQRGGGSLFVGSHVMVRLVGGKQRGGHDHAVEQSQAEGTCDEFPDGRRGRYCHRFFLLGASKFSAAFVSAATRVGPSLSERRIGAMHAVSFCPQSFLHG